jgi:hypothetical protein
VAEGLSRIPSNHHKIPGGDESGDGSINRWALTGLTLEVTVQLHVHHTIILMPDVRTICTPCDFWQISKVAILVMNKIINPNRRQ